jgi:8-oxo-dGTP pyrophosphatase MutT (NUDIX family)
VVIPASSVTRLSQSQYASLAPAQATVVPFHHAREKDVDVTLFDDAAATLDRWQATSEAAGLARKRTQELLAAGPVALTRAHRPGHVTASALIVDEQRRVLLCLHGRLGLWMQVGGHCEATDGTLAQAALREATEESGISGLRIGATPVHLDVHPITCSLGLPTRHFDVRFMVHAPAGAQPVRSPESVDLQWWPVDALPPDPGDVAGIAAMLAAAR